MGNKSGEWFSSGNIGLGFPGLDQEPKPRFLCESRDVEVLMANSKFSVAPLRQKQYFFRLNTILGLRWKSSKGGESWETGDSTLQ